MAPNILIGFIPSLHSHGTKYPDWIYPFPSQPWHQISWMDLSLPFTAMAPDILNGRLFRIISTRPLCAQIVNFFIPLLPNSLCSWYSRVQKVASLLACLFIFFSICMNWCRYCIKTLSALNFTFSLTLLPHFLRNNMYGDSVLCLEPSALPILGSLNVLSYLRIAVVCPVP